MICNGVSSLSFLLNIPLPYGPHLLILFLHTRCPRKWTNILNRKTHLMKRTHHHIVENSSKSWIKTICSAVLTQQTNKPLRFGHLSHWDQAASKKNTPKGRSLMAKGSNRIDLIAWCRIICLPATSKGCRYGFEIMVSSGVSLWHPLANMENHSNNCVYANLKWCNLITKPSHI